MDISEDKLVEISDGVRKRTFEMVIKAGAGHMGGSFSSLDILIALYHGGIMNVRPEEPDWDERDRFVLSKAHASNAYHVLLSDFGFFPDDLLESYLQDGGSIGGHTDLRIPGIEVVGGALGHGFGIAAGLALGAKLKSEDHLVFSMVGDGESQEGSIWEAAMFASQHNLSNFIGITDYNGLGSEDFICNTVELSPLDAKWEAFGWEVRTINGHSFSEIFDALSDLRSRKSDRPLMLLAKTIKGKGLSSMENTPKSHHTLPKGEMVDVVRSGLN